MGNDVPDSEKNQWTSLFATMQGFIIAVVVVIAMCEVFYVLMAFKLNKEFEQSMSRKFGTDLQKKRMYCSYHILLTMLKLDVFFYLAFGWQFLELVLKDTDLERELMIAALHIMFIIIIMARVAMRWEYWSIMLSSIFGIVLTIIYFSYKTVWIWTDPLRADKYRNVAVYLTVFSVLSLIMNIATLFMSIVCFRNFGKGLEPYLSGDHKVIAPIQQQQQQH